METAQRSQGQGQQKKALPEMPRTIPGPIAPSVGRNGSGGKATTQPQMESIQKYQANANGSGASLDELKKTAALETTEALKTELARLLGFSAENLLLLAVVVAELERRGEDLSAIKMGLLPLLRSIADGLLLPAIVVHFAGQPAMIRSIARLPIDEQRKVLNGTRVVNACGPPIGKRRSRANATAEEEGRGKVTISYFKSIAENGNPRDVAEMAASMVKSDEVLRLLLSLLSRSDSLSKDAQKALESVLALLPRGG